MRGWPSATAAVLSAFISHTSALSLTLRASCLLPAVTWAPSASTTSSWRTWACTATSRCCSRWARGQRNCLIARCIGASCRVAGVATWLHGLILVEYHKPCCCVPSPPHNPQQQDNFIHADLHPGNILVRLEEAPVPLPGGLLGALRSLLPFELKLPRLVSPEQGLVGSQ